MTNVDHRLPVDKDTVFQLGSISKSCTAVALLRLVADGRVDLDAPVRRYVPEFRLTDERAAAEITVLNLLSHTSGLDWNVINDTGEGDGALADFVATLAEIEMIAPVGARTSCSQAGYNLLGRIVEKVTGLTFEQAVTSLVLEPLDLNETFLFRDDVMTRRFVAGYNVADDATMTIARPWSPTTRANKPGAGLICSPAQLLKWASFHLGEGRTANGTEVLPATLLEQMRVPTPTLRASSLGDGNGLCWFLREVDGARAFGHGGSGDGQFAEILVVPEHDFAIVTMANAAPNGIPFNQEALRWTLEHYLGLVTREPEPLPYDERKVGEIVGLYENDAMIVGIATGGEKAALDVRIRPEIRESSDVELPPDHAPAAIDLVPGDEYIVLEGGLKGQRGYFSRDVSGAIVGLDPAGRLFSRAPSA